MKKLLNKCCALICTVVILLSLTSVASASDSISIAPTSEIPFAAVDTLTPGIDPLSAGSGYNQGTMTYNGKSYAYNVFIQATTGNGYRTGCHTEAACESHHSNLSVEFNTKNYGIVPATGGAKTCYVDDTNPSSFTSYSFWVPCPKGNAQIVSFPLASGTVVLTGTTPNSFYVRWW